MKKITLLILLLIAIDFGYAQTTLAAGEVAITGVNTRGTDRFAFVLLTDIEPGTIINFTDSGWVAATNDFRYTAGGALREGIVSWTSVSYLPCGTEVIITDTGSNAHSATSGFASEIDLGFNLSASGDQIIAFQGDIATPTFLYAIHLANATGWTTATDTNTSAVPLGLTDGTNAAYYGNFDNGKYDCTSTSGESLILADLVVDTNWTLVNGGGGAGPNEVTLGTCTYTCGTCLTTVTWDSGAWIGGTPSITTFVILNDDYTASTANSFSSCALWINPGINLLITDGYVEVENELTLNIGGTISVQPYGSFIQNNDASINSISGDITVTKKTAPMNNWYEYTYWSSPVENETIGNGLFESQYFRRFAFNASQFNDELAETGNNGIFVSGQDDIDDEGNDWYWVSPSTTMSPGVGYASTHDESAFIGPGSPPYQFDYVFEGDFNNGLYNVPVNRNDTSTSDFNWNFIGNPYPSAIDVDAFITENMYDVATNPTGTLDGVVYFWSQNTDKSDTANGDEAFNFTTSDYATHNGVGSTPGGDGLTPNGSIPSGQGFFVSFSDNAPSNSGDVIFNNSMRSLSLSPDNSQFFRGSNSKKKTSNNVNKLWINLTSDNGVFNQILVGYVNGSTNDDDGSYYDARKIVAPTTYAALYSTIENSDKKYVIQGKDVNSINEDEIVNLGFSTSINVATLFKLSVAQLEGDFLTGHSIYLKDNLLNKLHNLTDSDYTFTSEVGEFNNRFEIVFNANALSTEDINTNSNTLKIVELGDDNVKFTASTPIKTISIFDLLGRQLYQFEGRNNSETYRLSNLSSSSSIYIAKVELSNGATITKKAFKK